LLRNFLLKRCLANAGAQETAVIFYAYPTAGQKIRDCCHRFGAATRAGTNCQDEIPKGKSAALSDNLAKFAISLHTLAIFALSRSNAMSPCEYFFHRHT